MTAGFILGDDCLGALQTSIITHNICDLDQYLVDYQKGEVEKFSLYTAFAVKNAIGNLESHGAISDNLQQLFIMPIDDLKNLCSRFYGEYGSTTAGFKQYGLSPLQLYLDHHDLIAAEINDPSLYVARPDPDLRHALLQLQELGICNALFTNGTFNYAHAKTGRANLKDCFNAHIGIDVLSNNGKLTYKHMPVTWVKFLAFTQIPSRTGYVIGKTDRPLTEVDCDWSNCLFGDDDPRMLFIAKTLFHMQTILKVTDRITLTEDNKKHADVITRNPAEIYSAVANSLRYQDSRRPRRLIV